MQRLFTSTFLIILTLSLIGGGNAFATQFIPYIGIVWQHTPDVCIFDNTAADTYGKTALWVTKSWGNGLNHLTHSKTAWNMTLRTVDRMGMANCDITFIYDTEKQDWADTGKKTIDGKPSLERVLGMTSCNNDGYFYQIPYHCTVNMHILGMENKTIWNVSLHEFGHALGLGHRDGDTRRDAISAYLSDDIMYAYSKPWAHLTNDDILALIHLYGHSGFKGNDNPPDEYVINHPTHIAVYCNGVNATGGICSKVVTIK